MESLRAKWSAPATILTVSLFLFTPAAYAGFFDDLAKSAEKLRETAEDLSRARKTLDPQPEPAPPKVPQNAPQTRTDEPAETASVESAHIADVPENLNRSRSHVAQVQKLLNQLGYSVGPADGLYGRNTGNGIRSFQSDRGLTPRGDVTEELIVRLNRESDQVKARSVSTAPSSATASAQTQARESAGAPENTVIPQPAVHLKEPAATASSTATPARVQYDADGNQAVQAALFAWALGQHPDMAASPQVQMAVRQIEGLPGPAVRPKSVGTGAEVESYLREVSRIAREIPPPGKIRIEIPARLQNRESGYPGSIGSMQSGPVLSSQTDQIDGTAALLRVYLQWPGMTNALADWVLEKPFYLPLPAELTPPARERGNTVREKTLLSVVLHMSDPVAKVRGAAPYLSFTGVSAQARVESVDLVRRIERRSEGTFVADPDHVLASWRPQSTDRVSSELSEPMDLPELVSLFGGAINGDRFVPLNVNSASLGGAIGATTGQIRGSYGAARSIETALAFGAILNAGGERALGPEAVQTALRSIVTEREKYDLFPVSYLTEHGDMNELQRRSASAEAEPGLRSLIATRMPPMPLKVRNVVIASLGEYDFTLQGFPIRAGRNSAWMPKSPVTGAEMAELVPDFLRIPEAEAQALLDAVNRQNELNRSLFIAIDYTLTGASARSGRSGPIQAEELALVRFTNRIDAVTVYSDPALTNPIMTRQYEVSSADTPRLLPDALYATTGKSLMAALGQQPGGREIVLQATASLRDVQQAAPGQRSRMAETVADEIIAAAKDDYWIGANWQLGAFDPAKGGFVVNSVTFHAVAHREDLSGITAPELKVDNPHNTAVLRVDAEQRAILESYLDTTKAGSRDGMRLSSYARVLPRGADDDRGQPVLRISAPVELLLGATEGFGWPRTDDHRVVLLSEPSPGPLAGELPAITAPEALLLDQEGFDLLAISLASEVYDLSAYERMLVERLLKERKDQQTPVDQKDSSSTAWGTFFENPAQPLTKSDIRRLVPVFRDWTLARAAALPEALLLPVGGQPHPLSGCRGVNALTQPQIEMNKPFLKANTPGLLGRDAVPGQRHPNLYGNGRPRAGNDHVFYWNGGGAYGGSQSCQYVTRGLRSIDGGAQLQNAPFTSAMVVVRQQPFVSPVSEIPDSFLYRLSVDELRFVPSQALNAPPDELTGFIVITAGVEAAEAFRRDQFGGGYKTVGKIVKGDWDPLVAVAPANPDILGMTLEMPLTEFIATAGERLSTASLYETAVPGKSMFGHATALVEPDTSEAITAIYADHVENKPVIALMRRLELDASEVTIEGLKTALVEKHGPDFHEERDGYLFWGALPAEEDTYGYCGGHSILRLQNREAVPLMETENLDVSGGSRPVHNSFWSEFGWPADFDHQRSGMIPDVSQCTPLVAVQMAQSERKLYFVTWLFDRSLAERLDALPRAAPARARIDL